MANNLGIDGLATGFRTTEVVNKLMAIEKQPVNALEKKKNLLGQQADAWREMNTRLNALKEAANALQSVEMFRSRAATLTNNEALAVTSATGAGLDNYDITVKKLSKGHSLTSDTKNSKDVALRMRGTFKINGQAVKVEPTDSLQKIADKINQTPAVNVTASIVQVNDGKYKLAIASKNSGENSKITFKDGGIGRGVLTNLGILNRKDRIKNQIHEASDAVVTVNGVAIQRSSNQINDAITNVGLDLKKENETSKVTIELDYDKIIAATRNLVEKYNDVMDYINQNSGMARGAFDSSTLMNIQSQLRQTLRPQMSGLPPDIGLLDLVGIKGSAGIEGAKSGHLELDETLFRKKLDQNIDGIAKLFGATDENGVFKKMYDVLFDMTGTVGLVNNQIKASDRQVTDINKQLTTLGERLEAKEQNYYRKFNAMEQALASMQNQEKWMAAQLSTINNNNFNNKNKTNEEA